MANREARRWRKQAAVLAGHFSTLGDDPFVGVEQFAGCRSLTDLDSALYAAVQEEVVAMRAALAPFDVFDLVELMRLREFPIAPVLALQPGYDGDAHQPLPRVDVVAATSERSLP
jgi:hypothetical protein